MVTVFEKPAKENAQDKAPVYDLTDEQYDNMSQQEKTKRFHSSFKFKTEMLTSKVLLIDSHFVQSEVFQIRDQLDQQPSEFLQKLLNCGQKQGQSRAQCLLQQDCLEQLKAFGQCQMKNQQSKYMCKLPYRDYIDCLNRGVASVNSALFVKDHNVNLLSFDATSW